MSALSGLHTEALGRYYLHLASVDSTNDYLKNNADRLPHGAAVTAGVQTAGKGRMGKRWNAQPDTCLALSVLLHGWSAEEMTLLPLLAGLAVCQGVDSLCGVRCGLKWSNDVLLEGKKLCGILCESRVAAHSGFAVVGMGVNLSQTEEDFGHLGLVYAQSLLSATGKAFLPEEVAASILNSMELLLLQYRDQGFEPLLQQYRARCVTLGRPVRVLWDGGERRGDAVDIAPDGALICRIDGALRSVTAGETSVRGIYGYI